MGGGFPKYCQWLKAASSKFQAQMYRHDNMTSKSKSGYAITLLDFFSLHFTRFRIWRQVWSASVTRRSVVRLNVTSEQSSA
jgi:hypothetical protein